MKKSDLLFLVSLFLIALFFVLDSTREVFESLVKSHPYILGFIKFAILASMGELLAIRIVKGEYKKPIGFTYKVIVWGFIGVIITLMFNVFAGGVIFAMKKGILPFKDSSLAFAFFTSLIMNLFFAPTFMGLHKYTDAFIELRCNNKKTPKVKEVVEYIDWQGFVGFVLLKTIPFFWVPIHTITFLMPPEYRVVIAAGLSLVLGLILAFSSMSKKK